MNKETRNYLNHGEIRKSVHTFKESLTQGLGIEPRIFPPELEDKAARILETHSLITEKMTRNRFFKILDKEREIKGDAKLGYVMCVDGRLPPIHFGRLANVWQEPAGLFAVAGDEGEYEVASRELKEALEREATDGRDVFDIVLAHTSIRTEHVCGFMAGRRRNGEFGDITNDELVKRNLEEIEAVQIPALENTYNSARKTPLEQVAVSGVFDTDTFGMVLNYGKANELSTTAILEDLGYKQTISEVAGEFGDFGAWRDKFTNANYFLDFYGNVVGLTGEILANDGIGLNGQIRDYISDNYRLTKTQADAFAFSIARTIAFQYLTGLSEVPTDVQGNFKPDHPFANHEERSGTITTSGESIMDKYNVRTQSFRVTASHLESAITEARDVVLPLLDKYDSDKRNHVVYVSTPVFRNTEDAREENRVFFEKLLADERIRERVTAGRLMIIPILTDTETGRIMEIPVFFNPAD